MCSFERVKKTGHCEPARRLAHWLGMTQDLFDSLNHPEAVKSCFWVVLFCCQNCAASALRSCSWSLSAIRAMNSELVGLPLVLLTV